MKRMINILQEFSIPLILGVMVAVVVANAFPDAYDKLIHTPIHKIPAALMADDAHDQDHDHDDKAPDPAAPNAEAPGAPAVPDADHNHDDAHAHAHSGWDYWLSLHFLINDIFMVFFFGIAAKEITESALPGGSLNPPSKAINPLLGTLGGVVGPVAVYLGLNALMAPDAATAEVWAEGWGIPTATDIALAWLVARFVFGVGHPAIAFLLLLAIADDAIGLGIIAFAYPNQEPEWLYTLLIIPAMGIAYGLRRANVHAWWPYVVFAGTLSWCGLYFAHLHPALALVAIVPFMPGPKEDIGFYREDPDYDAREAEAKAAHRPGHSTLENFEHQMKLPVDFGLFFFAFANAGVEFSSINNLTWIVLFALFAGKIIGIFGFSWIGYKCGLPYPTGMGTRHLFLASMIAGIGLTVALFVAGQAFPTGSVEQGAAKMGAMLSAGIAFLALALSPALDAQSRDPAPGEAKTESEASYGEASEPD